MANFDINAIITDYEKPLSIYLSASTFGNRSECSNISNSGDYAQRSKPQNSTQLFSGNNYE